MRQQNPSVILKVQTQQAGNSLESTPSLTSTTIARAETANNSDLPRRNADVGLQSIPVTAPEREAFKSPTSASSLNESTATSFHLRDYFLPLPSQLGAGSCLYMAATGIGEFLLNKASGITNPTLGGLTDLSEQWTIELSKRIESELENRFTDAVELLTRGGYVRDDELRFRAYADQRWKIEASPLMNASGNLPAIDKYVLFSAGGNGTEHSTGVMKPEDLDKIKEFLRTHESPVLFVFKYPESWHANIITGYDDVRQTFTMLDSSFGQQLNGLIPYTYDGRSPWGPQWYRGEYEMSYTNALNWGNHATGYTLAADSQATRTAMATPKTTTPKR